MAPPTTSTGALAQHHDSRQGLDMANYVLQFENLSVSDIVRRQEQGDEPLCPRCGAVVLVANTPERAKALGIPPGMRCSRDVRHVDIHFNLKFNWDF